MISNSKNTFVSILLLVLMTQCTSISPINDRPPNIAWVDTELRSVAFVYNYYDSVAPLFGWNTPTRDWYYEFEEELKDIAISRIYYLDSPPAKEMYHVIFTEDMIIKRVFTENHLMWLNGSEVSEEEKVRIKQRFNNEVLKKMEEYAIQKKLPDSIVYVRRKR